MKISEIYEKYKIMPSLQMHMLRVAAVASLICDNFDEPLPKDEIITASLVHDMGNIIKSKFGYFTDFPETKDLDYWTNIKNEYVKKYGDDEKKATKTILKEIGLSENIVFLACQNSFSLICIHCDNNDMRVKVSHYADLRVGPYGILPYEKRMDDLRERYKNRKGNVLEEERLKLIACGVEMEKQIFAKCKLKPEDINDEVVKLIIPILRDFFIE